MINRKSFFVIIIFFCTVIINAKPIVSYTSEAGRLGDKLILYTKSLWVAHKNEIPFLYYPFPLSDKLQLSLLDCAHQGAKRHNTQRIKNDDAHFVSNHVNIISFYYKDTVWDEPFEICTWENLLNDVDFLRKLKERIKPKIAIKKIEIPSDCLSVAVHVRKGTGHDFPLCSVQIFENIKKINQLNAKNGWSDKKWPYKFPPDQYYIDQINYLGERFKDTYLYIYIFTDEPNPQQLVDYYKSFITCDNIVLDSRLGAPKKFVLDDLFSMANFDILVRGRSNYAQIAQLIGDFKMVIFPQNAIWAEDRLIVEPALYGELL